MGAGHRPILLDRQLDGTADRNSALSASPFFALIAHPAGQYSFITVRLSDLGDNPPNQRRRAASRLALTLAGPRRVKSLFTRSLLLIGGACRRVGCLVVSGGPSILMAKCNGLQGSCQARFSGIVAWPWRSSVHNVSVMPRTCLE